MGVEANLHGFRKCHMMGWGRHINGFVPVTSLQRTLESSADCFHFAQKAAYYADIRSEHLIAE